MRSVSHHANKEQKQSLSIYLVMRECELNVPSQTSLNRLPRQLLLLLSGCHSTSLPDKHLSNHLRPAVSHISVDSAIFMPSNQHFSSATQTRLSILRKGGICWSEAGITGKMVCD